MMGRKSKDCAIDLGLEISRSVQISYDKDGLPCALVWGKGMQKGVTRNERELAAFCGCSHTNIQHDVRRALRKMRIRLRQRGINSTELKALLRSFK